MTICYKKKNEKPPTDVELLFGMDHEYMEFKNEFKKELEGSCSHSVYPCNLDHYSIRMKKSGFKSLREY